MQTAVILKIVVERNGWGTPAWLIRWIHWTTLTPIERYFHSINASLQWLGKPQPLHITAAERTAILMEILPSASPSIEILRDEHQSALFSPREGNALIARRAAWTIIYQAITRRIKIFVLGYN